MTLKAFFTELAATFDQFLSAIPVEERDRPQHSNHPVQIAIGHIKALQFEENRAPEVRTNSIIRSSWPTVKLAGESIGVFEKYKGDTKLRADLQEFLKSGVPHPSSRLRP